MTLDGYLATIELDADAGLFHGEVINMRDVLTFQGRSPEDLKQAFAETLADYRQWCAERGKSPEKPFSGTFTVRLDPELHRKIAAAAATAHQSLNSFVGKTLAKAAGQDG
jgi:predicted HicB family RNase H-like nuclease